MWCLRTLGPCRITTRLQACQGPMGNLGPHLTTWTHGLRHSTHHANAATCVTGRKLASLLSVDAERATTSGGPKLNSGPPYTRHIFLLTNSCPTSFADCRYSGRVPAFAPQNTATRFSLRPLVDIRLGSGNFKPFVQTLALARYGRLTA